jgi:hypothetical protein
MIAEYKILQEKGEDFKQKIIELKKGNQNGTCFRNVDGAGKSL